MISSKQTVGDEQSNEFILKVIVGNIIKASTLFHPVVF